MEPHQLEGVERQKWLDSLTNEERESLTVKLCQVCYHGFNNNPRSMLCRECSRLALEVLEDEHQDTMF